MDQEFRRCLCHDGSARDDEQFIVLRFHISQPKSQSVFECIDFVGCSKKDIDDALKIWGSPSAAKKGTEVATYGGHGNGGKFYMRQMFRVARMITYQNGLLNVFGFDEEHRYGFVKRFTDRVMSLDEALKFAKIDALEIPNDVRRRWKKSRKRAGFSVVQGVHPERFSGRATIETILEGVRYHPQARRLLRHKRVVVMNHGQSWGERLNAPTVQPREGFESPREINLPKHLEVDGERIPTKTASQPKPKLFLRTSDQPLSRSRELASLNAIDILGEVGCIGSYRLHELGFLRHSAECEFMLGECECAFLEESGLNSVTNDREKLVQNELTGALLSWIRERVDELAGEIAERRRQEKQSLDLARSSLFNRMLDKWKNQFMARLSMELFGGSGVGDVFGGGDIGDTGGGSGGSSGNGSESGGGGSLGTSGDSAGTNRGNQGGSGEQKRKTSKFPTVLLSGQDTDPFDDEAIGPFECDVRHPPVYQRPIDIENGVYWINTSRALAKKILERHSSDHPRWREYLFQRYVDIIVKQQLYELQKRGTTFTAEDVDNHFDKLTSMVHDAAAQDLEQFLFDETMSGMAANPESESENELDD